MSNLPTGDNHANPDDRTASMPSHSVSAPAPVLDSLAGYTIVGEVHRGGQGVVYQAVQKSTNRRVAIKVMREGPFAGSSERARFEREVQMLGALRQPNIVAIDGEPRRSAGFRRSGAACTTTGPETEEAAVNAVASPGIAVPPLNLAGNFKPLREEILAEITRICDSGFYILGPKVVEFESALAAYCGCKHALGMSSGTDAILAALMTLGVGPGDEVIVPTFTFFATAGCVSRVGATPVFCDIDPQTYNLDASRVERLITPRTRAIIPVHLYGRVADMNALLAIATRRGVAVIEDAAQSIGARESAGSPQSGTMGEFGATSFYPTKNLGAIGDAGALLCNDDKLYEKAKQMRLHGETQKYHHQYVGGNFRIDALQAAILTIKLRHLDAWTEARRERAATYDRLLAASGVVPELVRTPESGAGRHVYHQYVIRATRRDELAKHLAARQIGCGIYYPIPLHLQECFAYVGGKRGDHPHAEKAAAEVLALPMYPELTDPQQESVVEAIRSFYRG